MAVDDFLSRDTDAFVSPSKSYYPLKIPIAHYQLRHFISSPEPDLLYYASENDVYCLNAATRTQSHVATLPWEARCTASGHGYVCVGGADEGNFAAIKVAGFPPVGPADVDALLPLELASRSTLPRPPLLGTAHRVKLEKIGEDIVNSISIHKYAAEEDGQDEVVAVLTNNDKTVRIYSLTQGLETAVLDLPFPMNHATISPDGQLLVAVGDHNTCFFFERGKTSKSNSQKGTEGRIQSIPPKWIQTQEARLYVPAGSTIEGYFTTAWSPTGRLCAVGSECGYITVFDVEMLKRCEFGEEAIVQLISSTRPNPPTASSGPGPGAVRTMQFSPAPWDLLVWSEDQGRVCVADLRTGLKVKQVLNLDPKGENTERVEIAEFDLEISPELRDREAEFIRSYRRTLDPEAGFISGSDTAGLADQYAARLYLDRQSGVVESDNDPHGLTTHERRVLEALRTTRQRDERRDQTSTPLSINYTTLEAVEARREARREREAASRARTASTYTLTAQVPDGIQRFAPRRQASVVVSINEGSTPADGVSNITGGATTRSPNPMPAHTRRDNSDIVASTDDAWRTIEEALARSVRTADSNNGRTSTAPELRSELRRLRQLTQMRERLRTAREQHGQLEAIGGMGGFASYDRVTRLRYNPEDGLRSAGLAMSQDGRTLYCGTEEGIFEFKINVHQRKGFPAIKPR